MGKQTKHGAKASEEVTLKTIADELGVSFSTVSKALNNSPLVRDETKAMVLDKARELHYIPNVLARGLRAKSSRSISIIMNDTVNTVLSAMLNEITKRLSLYGYITFYSDPQLNVDSERNIITNILARQPDFILYSPVSSDLSNLNLLEDRKQQLIIFSKPIDNFLCDYIYVDYARGGYQAARKLLDCGHRVIQIISQPSTFPLSEQFLSGILLAFREYGMELQKDQILVNRESSVEEGYRLLESLWDEESHCYSKPFTAVITFCDIIAHGVYRNLFSHGMRIPEDVSVIGFDDNPFNEFSAPPLSTIRLPGPQLADACIEILYDKIQNPDHLPEVRKVVPTLVDRSSVAPAGKA